VSVWSVVFLGVIAAATLTTAIVQVGIILVAGRAARRVERLADQVEHELKPLFGYLNAIGRDAARAADLAAGQVERADRVFADAAQKVEQTLAMIQGAILAPAREGKAVVSGFRAAMAVLRELRMGRPGQRRADDEDALFI
jgi:hypothetical protein